MADSIGGDMIRGHIDSIILNSLLDGDKDTKQIRAEIESKAGGDFKLKQGTLYSSLQRISSQGFVTEYRTSGSDGVRRKFFQLTENGKAHIEKSQSTWNQSQSVINKLLDSDQSDSGNSGFIDKTEEIKLPSFDSQPVVTDFSTYSEQIKEHTVANSIVYDEDLEASDKAQNTSIEEKTSTDDDINGLLSILDAESSDENNGKETVTTYTYFETAIDKNVAFESSLSDESKSNTVPDENHSNKTPFDNFIAGYDDDNQYNSDISTDSFVADDKAVGVKQVEIIESKSESIKSNDIANSQKNSSNSTEGLESVSESKKHSSDSDLSNENIDCNVEPVIIEEVKADNVQLKMSDEQLNSVEKGKIEAKTDTAATGTDSKTVKPTYEQMSLSQTALKRDEDELDDFIYNVDETPDKIYPDQPSYREILSRLLENADRTQEENARRPATPISRTRNYEELDEHENKVVEFPSENETDEYEDDYIAEDDSEDIIEEEKIVAATPDYKQDVPENKSSMVENKPHKGNSERKKHGVFDYSDIISFSEEEGFKVATADRTNKNELGKILINKLNFHTAIIFFAIIVAETLLVGLTMNNVLKFPVFSYFVFDLVIFLLPAVSGVAFFIAPRRAVSDIRSFRSAFETALIVTLEALIVVLVVSVIVNLDFSVYSDVARMLFTPILAIINIPLYVIIRYGLLDRQMYYS